MQFTEFQNPISLYTSQQQQPIKETLIKGKKIENEFMVQHEVFPQSISQMQNNNMHQPDWFLQEKPILKQTILMTQKPSRNIKQQQINTTATNITTTMRTTRPTKTKKNKKQNIETTELAKTKKAQSKKDSAIKRVGGGYNTELERVQLKTQQQRKEQQAFHECAKCNQELLHSYQQNKQLKPGTALIDNTESDLPCKDCHRARAKSSKKFIDFKERAPSPWVKLHEKELKEKKKQNEEKMKKVKENRAKSELQKMKEIDQVEEDGYYCCHKFKLRKVRDTSLIEHVDKLEAKDFKQKLKDKDELIRLLNEKKLKKQQERDLSTHKPKPKHYDWGVNQMRFKETRSYSPKIPYKTESVWKKEYIQDCFSQRKCCLEPAEQARLDQFKCLLCGRKYNIKPESKEMAAVIPKILPCPKQHVYCLDCLKLRHKSKLFQCPKCEYKFQESPEVLETFLLSQTPEEIEKQKKKIIKDQEPKLSKEEMEEKRKKRGNDAWKKMDMAKYEKLHEKESKKERLEMIRFLQQEQLKKSKKVKFIPPVKDEDEEGSVQSKTKPITESNSQNSFQAKLTQTRDMQQPKVFGKPKKSKQKGVKFNQDAQSQSLSQQSEVQQQPNQKQDQRIYDSVFQKQKLSEFQQDLQHKDLDLYYYENEYADPQTREAQKQLADIQKSEKKEKLFSENKVQLEQPEQIEQILHEAELRDIPQSVVQKAQKQWSQQ